MTEIIHACTQEARLTVLEQSTRHLEQYEARQNGYLERLATAFEEERASTAARFERLSDKIDRLTYSLLGLMATVVGSLAIYILTGR